ncbi:FHA domain-containing protein [Nocardia sp. NPDC020380]|uniref:FHA domain-containing protein n=1 Tax=Nocardia sp. NPDC020380 TaxID=3364309 RepID=UPI00379BB93F
MDRQVEVVAGNHVVSRVAGALIVVAHRERGRLTVESRAAIAARALAELVAAASEQAPDGPGRLVARQATRWLMKDAERISPGEAIEFGILSAADTGGVAVFLHGSVTAVLAGKAVEYYRGSDAAFTVDRVAEHPARAAALFIDEGGRRPPELPDRGIGSLIEGVAQATGAVVWFDGASIPPPPSARTGEGRHRAEIPPPTAAFDAQPERDRIPLDPNLVPTRTSNRLPADLYLETETPAAPKESIPPTDRAVGPENDADLSMDAGTSDGSTTTPIGPESNAEVSVAPVDPVTEADIPATDPATEAVGAGGVDLHHAPTEMGGAPETVGTNPAPQPDPDLQRRLEATAKASALTVKVLGFKCARAHPSDPRSAFCTVCGMPVDQTQQVAEVIRPPLGMLVLDDGLTYMLSADAVVGRDPEQSEAARAGLSPLRIEDSSGGMSRAHAEIRLVNWDVSVVDRGSTNGTRVRLPGYRDWVRLQPNQPLILMAGAEIMLGNRMLRLEPVAPPPFG